jgi:hypothetical protein
MSDFDRKVEEASARVNKHVANIAERLEKETAEVVNYINNEVVPAVRSHSTRALRTAAEKLSRFADYMDQTKADQARAEQEKREQ